MKKFRGDSWRKYRDERARSRVGGECRRCDTALVRRGSSSRARSDFIVSFDRNLFKFVSCVWLRKIYGNVVTRFLFTVLEERIA